MTTLATSDPAKTTMVGMGQISAGQAPDRLKAVLGSCIGLVLYHPRLKTGVMAHIVLPHSEGRDGTPGKFANTALPHMLRMLQERGAAHGLVAKLAGGARMFGGAGPLQIGEANTKAVTQLLQTAGIRVVASDVGGTSGRRVTFDCTEGDLLVESVGRPTRNM